MTTAGSKVPPDDFAEGFKVGFQTVQGTANTMPGIPGAPGVPGNDAFPDGCAARDQGGTG